VNVEIYTRSASKSDTCLDRKHIRERLFIGLTKKGLTQCITYNVACFVKEDPVVCARPCCLRVDVN